MTPNLSTYVGRKLWLLTWGRKNIHSGTPCTCTKRTRKVRNLEIKCWVRNLRVWNWPVWILLGPKSPGPKSPWVRNLRGLSSPGLKSPGLNSPGLKSPGLKSPSTDWLAGSWSFFPRGKIKSEMSRIFNGRELMLNWTQCTLGGSAEFSAQIVLTKWPNLKYFSQNKVE